MNNSGFVDGRDDVFYLSRLRVNATVTPAKQLSFQVQVQDARVADKTVGTTGTPFKATIDVRAAFAISKTSCDSSRETATSSTWPRWASTLIFSAGDSSSMTSSGPLADLVLDTIRHVPAGTFFSIGEVEELQAQCSARLSLGERLLRLNELMLRAEQLHVES